MKLLLVFSLLAAAPLFACANNKPNKNYLRRALDSSMSGDGAGEDVVMSPGMATAVTSPVASSDPSIAELAAENDELSMLAQVLNNLGLAGALDEGGPYTVFAPRNKGFEKVADDLADMTPEEQKQIILYHVVEGEILSSGLEVGTAVLDTLAGETIEVEVDEKGKVKINDKAKVEEVDVKFSNGIIHIINKVLMPESAQTAASGDEGDAAGAGQEQQGLVGQLPYDPTVPILGGGAYGPGAEPTLPTTPTDPNAVEVSKETEEPQDGGMNMDATVEGEAGMDVTSPAASTDPSIAELAAENDELSMLEQVLNDNGLAGALEEGGPYTVFAPRNKGFEKVADDLADMTPEEQKQVILYHVVEGEILSSGLEVGTAVLDTLAGETIEVEVDEKGKVKINDKAKVEEVDVKFSNGIIHIINKVLMPESAQTAASGDEGDAAGAGQGQQAGLVGQLPYDPTVPILGGGAYGPGAQPAPSTPTRAEDCTLELPTEENPNDAAATACVSSCECADGCCIPWHSKFVCAPPVGDGQGGWNDYNDCIPQGGVQSFSN